MGSELGAASLTYREVGATRAESMPEGYGHVTRDVRLGDGPEVFRRAGAALLGWRMHEEAGLTVVHADGRAAAGVNVVLRVGGSLIGLAIPCRVVYAVDEPDRCGFAYGTLPGHPETGEEAFMLAVTGTGEVRFRVRAFSRPASLMARVGGPVTRLVQQYATDRYVTALRRLAHR
ncbi:hypothetical protein ACWT_4743 [Actinoplanes sp. SE50]|nr:uncharacterized protein ACPL_4874 [Actinoplanes sp. SE50/110]ATO84158.1 hypothetical protein ACWT_4743 [Actinoplanes sp. SE50]SLM01568.1 uncharacterized protein ACSP50_4804 [Actinoplanes sp. SE50/110]